MGAPAREGIQVEGHRRGERLPLAGRHLGGGSTVQRDRPDDLYVVGDHIPDQPLPSDDNLPADEPSAHLLHDGESLGQEVVERGLEFVSQRGLKLRELDGERFPLSRRGGLRLFLAHLPDPVLRVPDTFGDVGPELERLPPEILVGELRELPVDLVDLLHDREEPADLAVVLGPDDSPDPVLDSHNPTVPALGLRPRRTLTRGTVHKVQTLGLYDPPDTVRHQIAHGAPVSYAPPDERGGDVHARDPHLGEGKMGNVRGTGTVRPGPALTPRHDGDLGEPGDCPRASPTPEGGPLVRSEPKNKRRTGLAPGEDTEGLDGIGDADALDLDRIGSEARIGPDSGPDHPKPHVGRS